MVQLRVYFAHYSFPLDYILVSGMLQLKKALKTFKASRPPVASTMLRTQSVWEGMLDADQMQMQCWPKLKSDGCLSKQTDQDRLRLKLRLRLLVFLPLHLALRLNSGCHGLQAVGDRGLGLVGAVVLASHPAQRQDVGAGHSQHGELRELLGAGVGRNGLAQCLVGGGNGVDAGPFPSIRLYAALARHVLVVALMLVLVLVGSRHGHIGPQSDMDLARLLIVQQRGGRCWQHLRRLFL